MQFYFIDSDVWYREKGRQRQQRSRREPTDIY